MTGDILSEVDLTAMSMRQVSVLVFDFEDLFRWSDEAVLQRFRLTQRVNPNVVPQDLRADACQITRDLNAITLHFFRKANPESPGTEIFRFTFQAPTQPL
jgi:hypothetical protein